MRTPAGRRPLVGMKRLERFPWRLAAFLLLFAGIAGLAGWRALPRASSDSPGSSLTASGYPGYIAGIQFITPELGWIVATDPKAGRTVVLKTADGGRHWQRQLNLPTPTLDAFTLVSAHELKFFDSGQGLLTVPTSGDGASDLYRTRDGGAHWQRSSLPGSGRHQTDFLDARQGWLLVTPVRGASTTEVQLVRGQEKLYRTEDGGEHWLLVSEAGPSGLTAGIGGIGGIRFASPTTGWATGFFQSSGLATPYMTSDGGLTWRKQPLPALPGMVGPPRFSVVSLPTIFADRTGVLPLVAFPDLYLYTTIDAGQSWLPPLGPAGGQSVGAERSPGGVFSVPVVGFFDARHWWVGFDRFAAFSSDGGVTWTSSVADLGAGFQLSRFELVSPEQGWAIARLVCPPGSTERQCLEPPLNVPRTKLLQTVDRGAHWKELRTPPVTG